MMSTLPCADERESCTRPEITAASDIDSLPQHWEIEVKGGALLGRAFDVNLAGVLLNDSVGHRKAQAGAALPILRRSFRGEERIVNAMNVFLRDSRTGIRDHNVDAVTV